MRSGFGFCNPNHAAALACALIPFCFGWRGPLRLAGLSIFACLAAAIAATLSRTGLLVLLMEVFILAILQIRSVKHMQQRREVVLAVAGVLAVAVFSIVLLWMSGRFKIDASVLNRSRIWSAGLRLAAANPSGTGFGNSGELATAFLLPDGIAVRTLVNSHLTLLVEFGWLAGGIWCMFLLHALHSAVRYPRMGLSFLGLVLSAFASSLFDWHVLFRSSRTADLPLLNFILSWCVFAIFVAEGSFLSAKSGFCVKSMIVVAVSMSLTLAFAAYVLRSAEVPRSAYGFAAVGDKRSHVVYRDSSWSLKAVSMFFENGARFRIEPGVPRGACVSHGEGEIWLFGDVAESAWRFPAASVVLVSPPEFCEAPENVSRIYVKRYVEERDDERTVFY